MNKNIALMILNISASNGTERAVCNLSNILAENGLSVHIISMSSKEGDKPAFPLNKSVRIYHAGLASKGIAGRISAYLKFIRAAGKYCRENNIDVIMGTGHQINTIMYFTGRNMKKIACEHMNYQACPKISASIRKMIYPRLDAVVTLTNGDAENYRSFMAAEKVHVIPNSLSFPADRKSDTKTKRIIAVGRLTAQKNFPALIEAAETVKNNCPEWHIDIYGSGEDEEKLLAMIREKGLEGYVKINSPVKNIKSEYISSGMLAVSSIFEGLPMAIIEAESCGLPVVSFNCNYGPADLIHDGVNGFLVEVGDVKGLADKIITLAQDDRLRAEMGSESFINAKNYEPEKIAVKWLELVENI